MLRKQVCLYLQDMPHFDGFLSFDSSWLAMMVVFIVMLQQDFSPIQHATVDAFGHVAGSSSKKVVLRQFFRETFFLECSGAFSVLYFPDSLKCDLLPKVLLVHI